MPGGLVACLPTTTQTKTGFEQACREAIEAEVGFEAKDARLNPKLPFFCSAEIKRLCPEAAAAAAAAPDAPDASSLECMISKLPEIKAARCAKEVRRVVSLPLRSVAPSSPLLHPSITDSLTH